MDVFSDTSSVEFIGKRTAIYNLQNGIRSVLGQMDALAHRRSLLLKQIEILKADVDRLDEEASTFGQQHQNLQGRLSACMGEMEDFLDQQGAVQVYTDMSHWDSRVAFGGLVIEGGAMTTMMGDLVPEQYARDTNVCETLALCTAVEWAARTWPGSLLEVFSDCTGAIVQLECFVRGLPAPASGMMAFLRQQIQSQLGSFQHRILPRWITRESPQIRLCDALARRKLGGVPPRIPWLHMLELAQGGVRGRWTPSAMWALHGYHRASRRGSRLCDDQQSTRPPA